MLIPSEVFLTKASVCAGAPTSAASAERVFFAPLHVESVLPGVLVEIAQKAGDRVFGAAR